MNDEKTILINQNNINNENSNIIRTKIKDQNFNFKKYNKNKIPCYPENSFCRINWIIQQVLILALLIGYSSGSKLDVSTNCTFPPRWEGSWFLSGYQQSINIKGSLFSYRGKCIASDGNKYLIVDEKGCHRCLVIYEKHVNVLQYKESECDGDSYYMDQSNLYNPAAMPISSIINSDRIEGAAQPNSHFSSSLDPCTGSYYNPSYCKGREILQSLCDQIPGDALLFSLFREQAEPVKCPLKGPYTFTYNRGHGECKNPVSNIDSCTEDSRLLLSFQACPDVQGTESSVEELTCLAKWKDGNSRYLIGLVSHHHAITNEDRFRCFVYEKISTMIGYSHLGYPGQYNNPNLKDAEYKLAQSGDATCNGLDTADVGSRIMTLRKPPPTERCDFPIWLKETRHWYSIKGNLDYQFHSSDGSLLITHPNGNTEMKAFCEQINKQTLNEMTAVMHFISGCKKGFMCMSFYRRDINIAEIQTGQPATRLEDACLTDYFDTARTSYETLLAHYAETSKCPIEGLYHVFGSISPPNVISRHKRNHNGNKKLHKRQHKHYYHGHHYHHTEYHGQHPSLDEGLHINSDTRKRETSSIEHSSVLNFADIKKREIGLMNKLKDNSSKIDTNVAETNATNQNIMNITTDIYKNLSKLDDTEINKLQQNLQNLSAITIIMNSKLENKTLNSHLKQNYINNSIENENDIENHHNIHDHKLQHHHVHHRNHHRNHKVNLTEIQRHRRSTTACNVDLKSRRKIRFGCIDMNEIDIKPSCDDESEAYTCYGSWTENLNTYLIARHHRSQRLVCITYIPFLGNDAKLVIGDECHHHSHDKETGHLLMKNITRFGNCGDSDTGTTLGVTLLLILLCSTVHML